jgi:hypothetical protein
MKKNVFLSFVIGFLLVGQCWAGENQVLLTASGDSVHGEYAVSADLGDGFWRSGFGGVYQEDDESEYKWGDISITVGGDALYPGISCEVGLKAILGKAEENGYSGDIGTVAFTGRVSYDFAQQLVLPGAFKVYGGVDYSNEILSFLDTHDYLGFQFGLGIPLFEHASIIAEYSIYDMDMESGPGDWTLDDDEFRMGLFMKF